MDIDMKNLRLLIVLALSSIATAHATGAYVVGAGFVMYSRLAGSD
jgi:hypothetical protein